MLGIDPDIANQVFHDARQVAARVQEVGLPCIVDLPRQAALPRQRVLAKLIGTQQRPATEAHVIALEDADQVRQRQQAAIVVRHALPDAISHGANEVRLVVDRQA